MAKIVKIRVTEMYESCERWSYYVEFETDEGFIAAANSFETGSIYNNHAGLSREEARDRAIITAGTWGDFLEIEPDPFIDKDGVEHKPSMDMHVYTTRRELARRKQSS